MYRNWVRLELVWHLCSLICLTILQFTRQCRAGSTTETCRWCTKCISVRCSYTMVYHDIAVPLDACGGMRFCTCRLLFFIILFLVPGCECTIRIERLLFLVILGANILTLWLALFPPCTLPCSFSVAQCNRSCNPSRQGMRPSTPVKRYRAAAWNVAMDAVTYILYLYRRSDISVCNIINHSIHSILRLK